MFDPETALFADSEAAIPSKDPLPKFSGFLELLFASPYARNAAIVDPSPGIAPIKVPKPEDLIIVGKVDLNSKNVTTLSIFCFEKIKVLDANFFTGCSICLSASDTAKVPINIGIKPIPSSNSKYSKVNLGVAVIGSRPIIPIIIPKNTENKPFHTEFPVRELMHKRENPVNRVYSGGPKFKAILARNPAAKINITSLKVSPNTDEYKAIFIALTPLPFCASGYPSSTVAAAAGVPGVLIKIAVMELPNRDPLNIPKSIGIPIQGSK